MTAPAIPASNDAAAAYQRLRSHLAYLKLPAAAEALPGILDAARDGQLTTLDALEQLLGTEAAAAEQRKLSSRLRLAALPAPWTLDLSGVDLEICLFPQVVTLLRYRQRGRVRLGCRAVGGPVAGAGAPRGRRRVCPRGHGRRPGGQRVPRAA
jgi:hypothetical protein